MDEFDKALKEQEAAAPEKDAFDEAIDAQSQPYLGEHAEAVQAFDQGAAPAVQAMGNAVDFLDSPIRAGVNEVVKQGTFDLSKPPLEQTSQNLKAILSGGKAAGKQLAENIQDPFNAPAKAPLFSDIIKNQLDQSTLATVFGNEKEKKVAAGMTGLAADMVAPSMLAKTAVGIGKSTQAASKLQDYLKRASGGLKNFERNQVAKAMAKFETQAQFKNSKIDPEKVASIIVDNDLTPFAGDPAKMLEALTGTKRTNYVEVSPGLSREVTDRGQGIIGKKSQGMRDEIYEVAKENGINTQVPQFAVQQKLRQKAILENPLEGRSYSPEEVEARQRIVDGILKPYEDILVPGVPIEAVQELPRKAVPPPLPIGEPDLLPLANNAKNIPPAFIPERPQNPGIVFPGKPGSLHVDSIIDPVYPPEPKAPQSYGGVVTKEAQAQYGKDFGEWQKSVDKIDKQHAKEISEAEKLDEHVRIGGERTRDSLAKESNSKYDSAIKAWEDEVSKLQKDHASEVGRARNLDSAIENAKVKQAADRFIEKARNNKDYRKEVMDVDDDYGEKVIQALKAKVFNQPRHWSLEDMMQLRTNIGKRLSSAEFHADKPLTMEKEVLENIYHSLKEEISGSLRGKKVNISRKSMDAADYYEIQSNAIRRMMEASEILKGAALNEYKNPDLMAKLLAITSAGGVAGTLGTGAYLAGTEMSFPLGLAGAAAVGETYRQVKGGAPQLMAKGAKTLRSGLETAVENPQEVIKGLGAASRSIRDNYVMPQPGDQGYVPPQTRVPSQFKSIPEQLLETPLERDSEALLGNKRLVLAKFAQQAPEFFGMVAEAAKDDEQFKKVMGFLSNAPRIPGQPSPRDLFRTDKYDTFDGRIMDPQMKMLAMDDTRNNDEMDSIQKAALLNKIQKGDKIV